MGKIAAEARCVDRLCLVISQAAIKRGLTRGISQERRPQGHAIDLLVDQIPPILVENVFRKKALSLNQGLGKYSAQSSVNLRETWILELGPGELDDKSAVRKEVFGTSHIKFGRWAVLVLGVGGGRPENDGEVFNVLLFKEG
jgi:hypothetical protein